MHVVGCTCVHMNITKLIFIDLVTYCLIYVITQLLSLAALVNKGNCSFSSGQYDKARDYYQEALRFAVYYNPFAFTWQLGWLKRSHLRSKCHQHM